MRSLRAAVSMVLAIAVAGCAAEQDTPEAADPTSSPALRCEIGEPPSRQAVGEPTEPQLRAELLEMFEADQAERTGESNANNDASRTERLREIIDDHGWPAADLVGTDGATAAWAIAQHSDQDIDFQRTALDLMCAAVADGFADPTELAYLEDRVAVNSGEPQIYGTQFGGCEGGEPVPQPLADAERVHEFRAAVGLQPLDEYLASFADACATPGTS